MDQEINYPSRLVNYLKNKYEKLSDFSYIQVIMIHGFNVDIGLPGDQQINKRFISSLTKYLIMVTIFLYQGIGSLVTWNDFNSVLIVGNFSKGFQLGKIVTFLSVVVDGIILSSLFLSMSIKVIRNDQSLEQLIGLIKLISGHSTELRDGIDCKMVAKIRQDIRPLIFAIRFIMNVYVPSSLCAMMIGCFMNQSTDFFTTWKLVPTIIWSVLTVTYLLYVFWCQAAAIISVVIVCKALNLRLSKNAAINGWRIGVNHGQNFDKFLKHQIKEQLNMVQMIRKYKESLKLILGTMSACYFMTCTFVTYQIFALDHFSLSLTMLTVLLPFYVLGLSLFIILPSNVTVRYRKTLIDTYRKCDRAKCTIIERFKLTHILNGMRCNDSFSFTDYIPNIKHMFVVWVSYDNCFRTGFTNFS